MWGILGALEVCPLLCISSLYLFTCSCTRFVLKPFNGAKTETALEKKQEGKKWVTLFSLQFEGVWHVHFMPSQRLGNPTSICSPACPLSTPPSSPAAPRVTELNTLLIYYFILFLLLSSARKEAPQIPVTYNTLPAEPLIDFFDRNVLIRSLQMAWKDACRREGKRRGKVEEGRKSLLAFWHLPAFICVAFPEYGSKLGACMRTCYRAWAERLYNYNARLIKEKEYNRFQMNLCD